MTHILDFYTGYNTFFISSDNGAAIKGNWLGGQNINNNNRLLHANNLLGVRTASYGHIKGELVLLSNSNNPIAYGKYDHIVECGVSADSGLIQILECPGSQVVFEIKVKAGLYRIRIYMIGINSADIDEDEGNDRYIIEIWPDTNIELKVLKRCKPNSSKR